MGSVKHNSKQIRACVVSMALSVMVVCLGNSLRWVSAQNAENFRTMHSAKRMADGKWWMTENLNAPSTWNEVRASDF